MSSLIYPIGIISSLKRKPIRPVLKDTFEGGGSKTRSNFPDKYFLHQIEAMHPLLSHVEIEELISFHQQMNGTQDTFILRDNSPRRTGNHIVRFADDIEDIQTRLRNNMGVRFEQADAAVPLPMPYELEQAAGARPVWHVDASQELYKNHLGTITTESTFFDRLRGDFTTDWTSGTWGLGGLTELASYYEFNGSRYAETTENWNPGTTQPAATLFVIVRCALTATSRRIMHVGTLSGGAYLMIYINGSDQWSAYTGGTGGSPTAAATADTWTTIIATWENGSNNSELYINGTSVGTGTRTRSYAQDQIMLGAKPGGTDLFDGDIGVAGLFERELSTAEAAALHNLYAPRFGIARV